MTLALQAACRVQGDPRNSCLKRRTGLAVRFACRVYDLWVRTGLRLAGLNFPASCFTFFGDIGLWFLEFRHLVGFWSGFPDNGRASGAL